MKSVSIAPVVRLFLFIGVMVLMAHVGFAADPKPSTGSVSTQLAINLYCGTADLLEGDIGLLIGLCFVFTGLWLIIQGGKFAAAIPLFVIGALITAIPSLILSTLGGLGDLLKNSKISTGSFSIQTCSDSALTPSQEELDALSKNNGSLLPSQGTFTVPSGYCKAKPEDAKCN